MDEAKKVVVSETGLRFRDGDDEWLLKVAAAKEDDRELWFVRETSGAWRIYFHKPLKVTFPSGRTQTFEPGHKVELRVINGRFAFTVVKQVAPGLTKEQGMRLAYAAASPQRELYAMVFYDLCLTAPADALLSANEGWAGWRYLGWPENFNRTFAPGVTTRACEKWHWTERVTKVENTAGNSHSDEKNWGYRSLIVGREAPKFFTPEVTQQILQART